MPVHLHQPVAGLNRGDTYSGPMEAWLLVNGYASLDGDNVDHSQMTGVENVSDDPQLNDNREDPLKPLAGLAAGLTQPDLDDVVELHPEKAETLPPPRNFTVGREEDSAVEALYKERYDQSKSDVEVQDAVAPRAPGRRGLTVGADTAGSMRQANAVLAADPNAAEETKPKVKRTGTAKPVKKTNRALTEPRDAQPGEQHGVQGALTDK